MKVENKLCFVDFVKLQHLAKIGEITSHH